MALAVGGMQEVGICQVARTFQKLENRTPAHPIRLLCCRYLSEAVIGLNLNLELELKARIQGDLGLSLV